MALPKPQWYPGSWADEVERADEEAAAAAIAALQTSPSSSHPAHQTLASPQPSAPSYQLPREGRLHRSTTPTTGRHVLPTTAPCARSPLLPTPVDAVPNGNAFISDGKKRGMTPSKHRERKKRNDGSLASRDRSRSVERPSLVAPLPRSLSCHSPSNSHSTDRSNRSSGFGQFVAAVSDKAHPKVNPFGNAKPREVLLAERGLDWRQIDLELDQRSATSVHSIRRYAAEDPTRKEQTRARPKYQDKENKYRDTPSYCVREPNDQQAAVQDSQTLEKLRTLEEKRRHRAVSAPRRFSQREWSKLEPTQPEITTLLSDRANYAPILHETPHSLSDWRAKELDRRFLSQKYSQVEAYNIAGGIHPHSHKTSGIERNDPADSLQMKRAERTTLSRSVKRFTDFLCRRVGYNERMLAAREQHTSPAQQLFHEMHPAFQLSGQYPQVLQLRTDGKLYPYEAGLIRGTRDVLREANESAMSNARTRQGRSARTGHGGRSR